MADKTYYIETFGCQMNVHDSEKVRGMLAMRGYEQKESADDASLILYNTCSIRDKAEQKVFHRLDLWKRDAKGNGPGREQSPKKLLTGPLGARVTERRGERTMPLPVEPRVPSGKLLLRPGEAS